jgi:hypothetical protein
MDLTQLINDKIGRKEIICVVGILCLTSEPYLLAGVAVLGMVTQLIADIRKPRTNGNSNQGDAK